MSAPTEHDRLNDLALRHSILRESDFRESDISATSIARAVTKGTLERLAPGVYRHTNAKWDENINLSVVAARVPQAVIVLVSALQFHQIGSHQAHSIWLLLRNNAVAPRIDYPQIEVIKSGIEDSFTCGVDTHRLNGIDVRITNPTRTVVDCFKYRNRVGLELCLEALKDLLHSPEHHTTPAQIMEYAKLQSVSTVILPYLEALV